MSSRKTTMVPLHAAAAAVLAAFLSRGDAAARDPIAGAAIPRLAEASWIWSAPEDPLCHARLVVSLERAPAAAAIAITADNGYELFVNGTEVGYDIGPEGEVWSSVERFDIASRLTRGRNVIGVRAIDMGGVRGLVAAVRVEIEGQPPLDLVTDGSWRVAGEGEPVDYSHPEFVEGGSWRGARVIGPVGTEPWGQLVLGSSTGGRRPASLVASVALASPDERFVWPSGVAFVGDDCSVYVPLRGDAWGVCFRVGDWSRAYTEFDIPCPSKIGRSLWALAPTGPGAEPRLLAHAGRGAIGSPCAAHDGRSVLVAMAAEGDSFFHIWRIPVDGGPPERITDGPFHDIDPAELPDGRIVFASTRCGTFEEYHNPPSRALFVMDRNGRDIRPITFTLTFDNEPKVMADGRIAFVRTDNFFDRAKVETQIHVIRPDGTNGLTEAGAHAGADYGVRLRAHGYGSPAPLPDGTLAFISSRGNFIGPPGGAEESFRPLPGGLGDLAPLPDGRLLATVLRPDATGMRSDVLAVVDPRDGGVVRIHEAAGSIHSPVFLGRRSPARAIPDGVDPAAGGDPAATGFLHCQDVRSTRKTKAGWSHVRAVRVLGALALTTRSSHSHIVHAGHETVELGTVPIAPDGSFSIEVPADIPLALQAVDAEGRSELNEMSWIYVRPGEKRSCLGCHPSRGQAPSPAGRMSQALQARPVRLLGQGRAHRFRGNNSGVTGMMDLQFDRFREIASLNRQASAASPGTTVREEIAAQIALLRNGDDALKISAAGRLAIFRDRSAAPALAESLRERDREVRLAAAMALAACGTRESVPSLLDSLEDEDPIAAQAAAVALENLTGQAEPFQPFAASEERKAQAAAWRSAMGRSWESIEAALVARLADPDGTARRGAVVALGHVGGEGARRALREHVRAAMAAVRYPPFENDNRTDSFTFPADSPLNPRTFQEAARALGHLRDADSVPLLREILDRSAEPRTADLYLAEAAAEALGRIATPEAESALIETFGRLKEYWSYVGWYSDHPALYACHASPVHGRILEALDRVGSTATARIAPAAVRSIPTDPDRALFPENDDYETLAGRLLRRSGRAAALVETCLSLLGDEEAIADPELRAAVSATFPAWAGTPAPDNRAAQVLSLVCRDGAFEPRIREAYERYRGKPEDPIERPLGNPERLPQRHWVLFFLGRTLGNLGQPGSVGTLIESLAPELNEARHGRPDPSEPNIHFLQLEYTPCWRVTAAWALGRIGDRAATGTLLDTIRDLRNATDVRHAAAEALERIADPGSADALLALAQRYPEQSVRRALLRASRSAAGRPLMTMAE